MDKLIKLLEIVSGKKVIFQEVDKSTKTNFFNFNAHQKAIEKLKNWKEYKGYKIFYKHSFMKDLFYLTTKENELILIANVTFFDEKPQVDEIELKEEYRGKGIGLIIYEYFIDTFNGVYSGLSQTKGGSSIWIKLFNKGYNIYRVDNKGFKEKLTSFNELKSELNNSVETFFLAEK